MMNKCSRCGAEGLTDRLKGVCLQCLFQEGEAVSPLERIEADRRFGSLEIVQKLGQGGMGVVFKARQPDLDRFVALKILAPILAADPEFRERFLLEAKVLARLNHPNIVAIHEFGERDGLYFLVMEYVEGANLRHVLESGTLSSDELLKLVPPLCEALEYAHAEGVVHRDIKPENILVDRQGRVKVMDFGLAKMAASRKITKAGVVMGTPDYMAPEQLEAPDTVDHRADLYSLGAVVYEILTGSVPAAQFVRPSRIKRTDPRMDAIIERALAREPRRRYQTATQIKEAVTGVLTTPRPRGVPLRRLAAIGLGLSLVAALIFLPLHLAHQNEPKKDPAPQSLFDDLNSDDPQVREKATEKLIEEAAAKADVQKAVEAALVSASDPERRARLEHVLGEVEYTRAKKQVRLSGKVKIDPPAGGTPEVLAISPDRKKVVSWGPDRRLVLLDAGTLREIAVIGTTEHEIGTINFSPDGRMLAVANRCDMPSRGPGLVTLWEINSGKILARFDQQYHVAACCFSSDGQKIYTGTEGGLGICDVKTGAFERQVDNSPVWAMALSSDGKSLLTEGMDWALTRWTTSAWEKLAVSPGVKPWLHAPTTIAVSSDGSLVAQVRCEKYNEPHLVVWETGTGKEAYKSATECRQVRAGANDEGFAYQAGSAITITRWKGLAKGTSVKVDEPKDWILGTDNASLFLGVAGEIRKVGVEKAEIQLRAKPHKGRFLALAFHPNGKTLVTVGDDEMIRLWDAEGGKEIGAFQSGTKRIDHIAVSPDGSIAVAHVDTGSPGGELVVFDLRERKVLHRLDQLSTSVNKLKVTGDQRLIAGLQSGEIRVYDLAKKKHELTIKGREGFTDSHVDVSSDGSVAVRIFYGEIDAWSLRTGQRLFQMEAKQAEDGCLTADGRTLWYFNSHGKMISFDMKSQKIASQADCAPTLTLMTTDPAGRCLVLPFPNRLVLVHTPTLRELVSLEVDGVLELAFSPDGKRLAVRGATSAVVFDLHAAPKQDGSSKKPGINELLEDLSSDDPSIRDKATQKLIEEAATKADVQKAVEAALASATDPEIRARLEKVMSEIDYVRAKNIKLVEKRKIRVPGAGAPILAAVSPDGKRVVTWGSDRRLVLLDAANLKDLGTIATTEEDVDLLRFSPDGLHVAAGGEVVNVYEISTGKKVSTVSMAAKGDLLQLCFSKDGKKLFTSGNGGFSIWDVAKGVLEKGPESREVNAIALTRDGKSLLVQHFDCSVEMWDLSNWKARLIVPRCEDWSCAVQNSFAVNDNESRLAQLRFDMTTEKFFISVWDLVTAKEILQIPVPKPSFYECVATSGDGKRLAVSGSDSLAVYSWKDFKSVGGTIDGRLIGGFMDADSVLCVADGELRKVEEVRSSRVIGQAKPHTGRIYTAALAPDGRSLVTVGSDKMIRTLDVESGNELGAFSTGSSDSYWLAVSDNAHFVATSGFEGKVFVWDLKQRKPVCSFPGLGQETIWLQFVGDDALLCGGHTGQIGRYDLARKEMGKPMGTRTNPVCTIHFSRDGSIATRSDLNSGFEVWDVGRGVRLCSVALRAKGHGESVGAACLSPDGKRVFVVLSGKIKAFDAKTGKELFEGEGDSNYCRDMKVDPTGRYLVFQSSGKLTLVHAGSLRKVLSRDLAKTEYFAGFSADGKRLALKDTTTVTILEVEQDSK